MSEDIIKEINRHAKPSRVPVLQRFFKTGPGEYAQGDIFIGLTVPEIRVIAKKFSEETLPEIKNLLNSPIHEIRLTALIILTIQFKKASPDIREKIYNFYISNTKQINNWDLVDVSAPQIVGTYLLDTKNDAQLFDFAVSKNLWERRIAIVSTFSHIRSGKFDTPIKIAKILLTDKHDLIHKAVGWMLREVGKRDEKVLRDFLNMHTKDIPRTMLRYAIERFDPIMRRHYLKKYD